MSALGRRLSPIWPSTKTRTTTPLSTAFSNATRKHPVVLSSDISYELSSIVDWAVSINSIRNAKASTSLCSSLTVLPFTTEPIDKAKAVMTTKALRKYPLAVILKSLQQFFQIAAHDPFHSIFDYQCAA